MLLIGIDDAGRGPLIGPMILAGVLIDSSLNNNLKELGVKDSKLLSQNQRLRLSGEIKKISKSKILITSPSEIDSSPNLNTLEAKKTAEIINALNDKKT